MPMPSRYTMREGDRLIGQSKIVLASQAIGKDSMCTEASAAVLVVLRMPAPGVFLNSQRCQVRMSAWQRTNWRLRVSGRVSFQ